MLILSKHRSSKININYIFKKACAVFFTLSILSAATYASSQDVPVLIKNNNCVTCHVHNKKLMGPSWQDIAAKYKNNPNQADLATAIAQGSVNKWGSMRMPANPQLKKEEIDSIIKWVVSQ
jgi:cytochrome c